MGTPFLEWTDDRGAPHRLQLTRQDVLIGRRSDADVVLDSRSVSRHHARIVQEGELHYLVDLESHNGSFVNSRRVTREPLRAGDQIRVGDIRLVFGMQELLAASPQPGAVESIHSAFLEMTTRLPPSGPPQDDLAKLSQLLDFEVQWRQQFSADTAFHLVLANALKITGAERAYILRRGANGFQYALGLDADLVVLGQGEFRMSRAVVERAATSGAPVFMTEGLSEELAERDSIVLMNLRAVACIPLVGVRPDRDAPEVLGILYLDSTKPMHGLTGLDQRILAKLAAEAERVLEKLELLQGIEEKRLLERDLALARETQVALLPRELPDLQGFVIRALSRPARFVGGDFYDFVWQPDGRLVGLLADVSGKGLAASLLSSSLQGALQTQLRAGVDPVTALAAVNTYLCERSEVGRFATVFLFTLDRLGRGGFVNAGHPPGYLYRAATRSIESLATGHLILGAFETATHESRPMRLEPGDVLVAYTDGLTEASTAGGDLFGEERLCALIQRHGAAGVSALEGAILDALDEFTAGAEQADDITWVLVQRSRPEMPTIG